MSEYQTIAGVKVPDGALVRRAVDYAREIYEPYLFNHVMRSWLFAVRLAQIQGTAHDGEVLALGTLLHDMTLNEDFKGPRRFEVEAADLARNYALDAGLDQRRAQLIWDGVALNATPSIGLFKEAEVALCTAGICLDVVGFQYNIIPAAEIREIVAAYPRLGMKEKMARCFCHIARNAAETTYGSFIADYGHRFVEGYSAPSVVDLVQDAPFDE